MRTMMNSWRVVRALVLVTAALVAACSSDAGGGDGACTLIGCTDQITLRPLDPSGALVTQVKGSAVLDGLTRDIDCIGGTPNAHVMCSSTGIVLFTSAATVTVTLHSGDLGVVDKVLSPTYANVRPNGPTCGPLCKQATVDVQLGGGFVDATDGTAVDATHADAGGAQDAGAGSADTQTAADSTATEDTGLETDGGATDAGVSDSTAGDAATSDSAVVDAQTADSQATDSQATDSGGTVDAGKPPAGCCNKTSECNKGQACAKGVCKDLAQLKKGTCWTDSDCGGAVCQGAVICPCGVNCFAPDKPGTCPAQSTCSAINPTGYGLCEMLLGVGWDGSKCVFVSGCGCKEDCKKLFKTKAECEAACP
ncbi:MAG: hypothetical protein KC502_17945 [Myxococcales bacterium]|nr:hypothetical protein [Myxococcales bacterium]